MSTAAVTRGEDAVDVGCVLAVFSLEVAASVSLETQRFRNGLLGAQEAHRQQDQLGRPFFFAAFDFGHLPAAFIVLRPFDVDGLDAFQLAFVVDQILFAEDLIFARVFSELRFGFFVTVIDTEDTRPFRPWVVVGTFGWWLRQQLKVDHAAATMTEAGSDAVGPGVTTADDDHVLAFGADEVGPQVITVNTLLGVGREEVHREMNALGFATGDRQVAWLGGTTGQQHSIELALQILRRDVF